MTHKCFINQLWTCVSLEGSVYSLSFYSYYDYENGFVIINDLWILCNQVQAGSVGWGFLIISYTVNHDKVLGFVEFTDGV